MNSLFTFRIASFLVLIPCLILVAGCGGDDTPLIVKQAREEKARKAKLPKDSGDKSNRTAASKSNKNAAPKRSTAANSNSTRSSNSNLKSINKQLNIDDLLRKGGLHPKVQGELLTRRNRGQKTITGSQYETLVSKFDSLKSYVNRRTQFGWPSGSETEIDPTKKIVYKMEEANTLDYVRGRSDVRRKAIVHFRERTINGLDDAGKEKAAEFMERLFDEWLSVSSRTWHELLDEATDLQKSHSKLTYEPLFQFCFASVYTKLNRHDEAEGKFRTAINGFRKTEYPTIIVVYTQTMLNWNSDRRLPSTKPGWDITDYRLAIEYWIGYDFDVTPDEHRYAYELLNDFIDYAAKKREYQMLEAFMKNFLEQTHLPEWIRAMVRARYYHKLAWAFRGSGFANSVTPENWQKFEKYESQAVEYFNKAYAINPKFPEAAYNMMSIALSGNAEESQQEWFERTIEGQADYLEAYESRLNGLLPQWGGSLQEMVEFAVSQAKRQEYDTNVPALLITCYKMIKNDASADKKYRVAVLRDKKFVTEICEALDGLAENDREKVLNNRIYQDDYFLTCKAAIANFADMHELAVEAYEQLGDRRNPQAMSELVGMTTSYACTRSRSYALSGKSKDKTVELLDLLRSKEKEGDHDHQDSFEILDELMTEFPDGDEMLFYQRIHQSLTLESDYDQGKEISPTFDREMKIWLMAVASTIKYDSKDSILLDNLDSGYSLNLWSPISFPGSKMLEFDIELPEKSEKHTSGSHFTPSVTAIDMGGMAFSFGLNRFYNRRGLPSHIYDKGQLSFGYYEATRSLLYYETGIQEGKNRIRIYVMKGYYEVYLNDQFVFRSINKQISGGYKHFGMGQPKARKGRGRAKISNIKIKKWHNEVPPFDGEPDDLIAFYEKEVEREPDNPWRKFFLAQAIHQAGKFESAIDRYKQAVDSGIENSKVAFYVGDCFEQLGNIEEAIDWYQIAADKENLDITKVFPGNETMGYCNPGNWAAFRLRWISHVHPDETIRSIALDQGIVKVGLPLAQQWALNLLEANKSAKNRSFQKAEQLARQSLPKCSIDQEDDIVEMIAAFKDSTVYRQSEDEPPFYSKSEQSIPFFRSFEDALDSHWNRAY